MATNMFMINEDHLRQVHNDISNGELKDYNAMLPIFVFTALRHKEHINVMQRRGTELVEENRRLKAELYQLKQAKD